MNPVSGNWRMASRVAGNQTVARNQITLAAASSATMNWIKRSRPRGARENAATPRGVNGCHAGGRGRSSEVGGWWSDDGLDSSFAIRTRHFVWVGGPWLGGGTTTRLIG